MIQIAYFRDVGGRGRYLGKRKEICTKKKPKQAIAWVSGVGGWCSITGTTWQGCLITNPSIFQCHFMEVGELYCDWYEIKNKVGSKLKSWKMCTVGFREVETGKWKLQTGIWPVSCTIFRNLLAGIWGSFLRLIETGFRNWLAAFLGFSCDFSMMSMIFL